jgi:hypothetical protein
VFESREHLLHGLLHLNGYGHLLRMNGSQGGSRRLVGARASCWAGGLWRGEDGGEGEEGGGWRGDSHPACSRGGLQDHTAATGAM